MTAGVLAFPVHLPRHAFSPRDAARAGDVWRACQEVAVHGSALCGWPPDRYKAEGSAFVVRDMTVVHHREARFGESLDARTWIGEFRRALLIRREVRLDGVDGPLATATQEWAHVTAAMRAGRAPQALIEAFTPIEVEPSAVMPELAEVDEGPLHRLTFRAWHTWMDPLAHANHPAYVDWCDEAVSRAMASAGLDPVALAPVAERVRWKKGVVAGDEVEVETRRVGRTAAGDVVFEHRVAVGDLAATATTVRRLADGGTDALGRI